MDNANGYETLEQRRKRILGVGGDTSNSSTDTGSPDNTDQGYVSLEERRKQMQEQQQQEAQQAAQQKQQQQAQPPQQPTLKPNTKPVQLSLVDRLKQALGGTAHMINNVVSQGVSDVEGFLSNTGKAVDNAVQPQNPYTKDLPANMPNVNTDNVKKKAEQAYLNFPSLFDNPDKVSQQEGTMTPETLQHMAYRAKANYQQDPIGASIATTNDFLTYHPEVLKTLAYIQDGMGVVGKAIDDKLKTTAAGQDVEQLGTGVVQSATTTYLGSSKTIQNTLSTTLKEPVTMDQKVFNTVGQVMGGIASFVAGGEILKGAQLGKAAMPILFGTLGMTSAAPDTSFSKRLTIGAINALGGKYFQEAGDTSAFSPQAIKAFAKVQGINTVMTGLSDLLQNKKPKDIATDLATSGVVLGLFHVVGAAQGLFNKQVTDLASGKVPENNETPVQQHPEQNQEIPQGAAQEPAPQQPQQQEEGSFQVQPADNLSPEKKAIENKFTDYLTKNTDEAIQRYNALPDSQGGKVLSADTARELSPDYANDRSGSSDAVHEPSSALIREMYTRKLAEQDPEGKNIVLFTAGGTGAGKSTAVANIPAMKDISDNAQMIYDTNLAKPKSAISKIQQALDAGKQVVIGYVHRDPVDALVNGALPRAMKMGRTVPLAAHLDTHVNAPDSLLQVAEHFKGNDNVQIRVIDNSLGRGNAKIVDLAKLADLGYNKDELRDKLSTALENEYTNGNISEQVYNGTKNGTTSNREGNGGQNSLSNGQQPQQPNQNPAETITPANQNVTFQSKETRAKQETFTKALDTIRASSTDQADSIQKVTDLVGKTLDNSNGDRATIMGMRTALNKEMMESVGDHGSYKKNYAMLKYMQASDSDNAQYLSSLEDHINLLDDVIRSRSMDDFARTFGQVPSDLPAPSEKPGMFEEHNIQLMHGGIGPNPNIDKFVEQDVLPYAKETVTGMKKAFNEVRAWLSPTSTVPKAALDTIMAKKGDMEQSQFRAEQATKDIKNMWDKQNDKSRFDFMHQVETGADVPEKFQPIADFYRQRLDDAHKQIMRYKDIPFLENFFPHFWEKPEDVQKFLASVASRRPLEGSKSFLKNRVFATIQEGMDLGYKPVSTNPEELMQIYEQNVRKFTMAQEIKNDLIAKGFWKFVRSGDKVPAGFSPINDNIAKVYFPPSITEVKVGEADIRKMIEAGQYHAQDDVARIINNYLSTDLIRDTAIGKGLMNMKNTMNAFELGFSAFHGTMETLDSIITHGSIGFSKIFNEGKVFSGLKDIITSPTAPVKYFRGGQKFYNGDPELLKIEQDLFTGGATLANKQYFKNTVYDTFLKRVREGNVAGAAVRTPLAVTEAAMRPLMSYYIPRLKIGAFRHLFSSELERNSQAIQDGSMTREELARKTWSNVENRMGELNYDNLFWNRTLKAAMMLGVRAVGWNLGTAREIGGGVFADAPAQALKLIKLQRPELTPKMAYTLNLLFTTAAVGSVYQYLHTGKAPQNLLDMFYPQNGGTNQNGQPTRVQFPTYLKDMYSASHNPVQMVENKMAPEISTILDLLNNKDYYGNIIHNPNDNLPDQTKQVAAYMINSLTPFSVQSVQQQAKGHATIPEQLENFLGIQKAPIDTMQTDKEKRLYQAAQDQMGIKGPQTPEQQHTAELKTQARKDILEGKRLRDSAAFMELVHQGTIKTRLQAENFVAGAKMTPDQRLFKGLSKDRQRQVLQGK